MTDFTARVWTPGASAPAIDGVPIGEALALDRALLRVVDSSISRTPNAPRLVPRSTTEVELEVPERSVRGVLLVPGWRFEALQMDVPLETEPWRLAPGQLGELGRVVRGAEGGLALLRPLRRPKPGEPTHYLVVLPALEHVRPGQSLRFTAPALLVLGEAALDVTPVETVIPIAAPAEAAPAVRGIDLRDAELWLDGLERLDDFARPAAILRLPESDVDLDRRAAERVAQKILQRGRYPYCFLPVLEDGRWPRLALCYSRAESGAGIAVSGADPTRFLQDLRDFLSVAPARPAPAAAVAAPAEPVRFGGIETRSAAMAAVLRELDRVAGSDLGILLLGESGTGKEHLATAIHRASPRSRGPFVAVNCSSLPGDLIESELFGHKKGAFTGAQSERAGAFSAADGGTLLLDEIGDAPLRVQVALLRALETRRIRPVGSDADRPVDVRVLAATSRDLAELRAQGSFRDDLYYRLAELTVELPPLRRRTEDLPILVATVLRDLGSPASVSEEALRLLARQPFPGNVRELKNALKRALALAAGVAELQAVHFAHFGDAATAGSPGGSLGTPSTLRFPQHVVEYARRLERDLEVADESASKHERRALQRAALLYLATVSAVASWPRTLVRLAARLFGPRWAAGEDGRAVRELLREIGMDAKDERAQAEVVRVAGVVVGEG